MIANDGIPSFDREIMLKNGRFFDLDDLREKTKVIKELLEISAEIKIFQIFGKGFAVKIYNSRNYMPIGCLARINQGEDDYRIVTMESIGMSTIQIERKFQRFAFQGESETFVYWVRIA